MGFPGGTSGKEPTCQCRRHKRHRFNPWVGKIPWRRAWQPMPVFLPGKSHGQRSLVGYSPWGLKESDATERLHFTSLLLAHIRSLINTFCCICSISLCSKESACNAGDEGDTGSILGSGRSPGGGHGNPLQNSCLENCIDRRAWRAVVHRITKSRTRLK